MQKKERQSMENNNVIAMYIRLSDEDRNVDGCEKKATVYQHSVT